MKTMMSNFSVLSGCLREEAARSPQTKKIDLEFIVKGNRLCIVGPCQRINQHAGGFVRIRQDAVDPFPRV